MKFTVETSHTRFNHAGFSLLEMMISVAIVGIAFTLSLDQIFALNNMHRKIDVQNQARMDAKLISDYLTKNIRQVGGSRVRPWMSLWVENNCSVRDGMPACNGADRITYAQLNRDLSECFIVNAEAPNRLHFNPAIPQCCAPERVGQQVIVTNASQYGSFYVTAQQYNGATNQCFIEVTPGQLYGLNAANAPGNFTGWLGASVTPVKATTIYFKPNANEIRSFSDINNNRQIDADEELLLADQVIDLQFLLGFDRIPQDGSVENLNNDQDEWMYNSVSNNEQLGQGGLASVTMVDLRMFALGVITEGKHYGNNSETRLYDGPLRSVPNSQLTVGESRIYLRSTFIYNN